MPLLLLTLSSLLLSFVENCWSQKCYIFPEKTYFEKRQSLPHYKHYLDCLYRQTQPWKLFATTQLDEETLRIMELRLEEARAAAEAMQSYLTSLQRLGHGIRAGVEIVGRDGYSINTADLELLQGSQEEHRQAAQRTAFRRGSKLCSQIEKLMNCLIRCVRGSRRI